MILEHLAFDIGNKKIFNITGVVRDNPGSIALQASSLALPGTTGVTPGKHRRLFQRHPGTTHYDMTIIK
jgi:hypothetical protein